MSWARDGLGNETNYTYGYDTEGPYQQTHSGDGLVERLGFVPRAEQLSYRVNSLGGRVYFSYDAFSELSEIRADNVSSTSGWDGASYWCYERDAYGLRRQAVRLVI